MNEKCVIIVSVIVNLVIVLVLTCLKLCSIVTSILLGLISNFTITIIINTINLLYKKTENYRNYYDFVMEFVLLFSRLTFDQDYCEQIKVLFENTNVKLKNKILFDKIKNPIDEAELVYKALRQFGDAINVLKIRVSNPENNQFKDVFFYKDEFIYLWIYHEDFVNSLKELKKRAGYKTHIEFSPQRWTNDDGLFFSNTKPWILPSNDEIVI